ncbi:deoxyribonuclease IV [Patescibacteria group bacterium]|nr:deoxyribonuclease IV [Patescibacteria group bacterium]
MSIIGAHVSATNGLQNCFVNAKKIGAECIQIFGTSPRQWKVSLPTEDIIKKFKQAQKKSGISPVFLHASYLINLASPENRLYYGSISHLAEELKIVEVLGAQGLVFHLGSSKDGSKADGIKKIIKGIKEVLAKAPGKAQLIMENTAGGGNKIGAELEDLGKIYKGVNDKRLKICLDTAHGFEAGIFDTFDKSELDLFVKKGNKLFGWKNVVAMHINDSWSKHCSHHDRHENIGEGEIGVDSFQNLAKHSKFNKLPWILEVPGFDGGGPDKKNIKILHGLFNKNK